MKTFRLIRWLSLVLILALAIPGTSQSALGQSGTQVTELMSYDLSVIAKTGDPDVICPGDDVTLGVEVVHEIQWFDKATKNLVDKTSTPVIGAAVSGEVQNSQIGTLAPAIAYTGVGGRSVVKAEFTFHAKKKGTTTIAFHVKARKVWRNGTDEEYTFEREIEVKSCLYSLKMIYQGGVAAYGGAVNWIGLMDTAHLTEDSENHFLGSASYAVTEQAYFPGCSISSSLSDSSVDITADRTKDHVEAELTFGPMTKSVVIACPFGSSSAAHTSTERPQLTVSFPAEGGVVRLAHDAGVYTFILEHEPSSSAARSIHPEVNALAALPARLTAMNITR